jgi:sodium-dependent dicarboxylate transporter 2/3/5
MNDDDPNGRSSEGRRWGPGSEPGSAVRRAGLVLGPVLAVLVMGAFGRGSGEIQEMGPGGPATVAIAVWMAIWWLTEALPIQATALLPLALFAPVGVATMRETAAPYANPMIFLFMGGFMIALAMQSSGLSRRTALTTLRMVGDRPRNMIAGFMLVAGGLSMWVSNTATTVMMLPVALSVLEMAEHRSPPGWNDRMRRNFAVALLLGIAYGASIGGVATPVGTPPNLFLLSFLSSELDQPISFARWMAVGVPVVLIMLPTVWWVLVHRLFPFSNDRLEGGRALFVRDLRALGPPSRAERIVLGVFFCVCLLWLAHPLLANLDIAGSKPFARLDEAGIAVAGALVLFCAPAGDGRRVLDWETAKGLPWGILILFGGGLSLAAAIKQNGVDRWIGSQSHSLAGLSPIVVVVSVVTVMVFLTELTSNTASTAAFVPILASLAVGLGLSPLELVVPATLAASFAFMLPVATPPNAVVFGSGRVTIRDMMRAGLWLNLIGIVVISALTFLDVLPLLGG